MAVYACSRPCGRPCMWPNMHTATCACSRTQIQPMHACGRTCTWQFVRMAERACGRQLVSAEQETNNRTRPRADAHSAEWKVTTHVFVDQSVTNDETAHASAHTCSTAGHVRACRRGRGCTLAESGCTLALTGYSFQLIRSTGPTLVFFLVNGSSVNCVGQAALFITPQVLTCKIFANGTRSRAGRALPGGSMAASGQEDAASEEVLTNTLLGRCLPTPPSCGLGPACPFAVSFWVFMSFCLGSCSILGTA